MRPRTSVTASSVFALLIAGALLPAPLRAQEAPHPAADAPAPSGISPRNAPRSAPRSGRELWGGLAQGSPSWGVLGEAPGMNLGLVGLRFSRPLGGASGGGTDGPPPALPSRVTEWHVDLVPLAVLSTPYRSLRGTGVACPQARLCVAPPTSGPALFPRGSAFGFGVNPAGLTTRFRNDRRVSPSLGVAVGGILFDRRVPTTGASRANFTAAIEAGVRVGPPEGRGIALGYRFHHISNGGTAGENPGVASHLLTLVWRYGRGEEGASAAMRSARR
jgi:hypothetical protein